MVSPISVGQLPECSICFSEIQVGVRQVELTCQHIFHRHCLHQWLAASESNSCPSCRVVTTISFRALYEEDYVARSACFARLSSSFEEFDGRVISVESAADDLLRRVPRQQVELNALLRDCSNLRHQIILLNQRLRDRISPILSMNHNNLLELDSLTANNEQVIDRIVQVQRRIVFEQFPVQEAIDESYVAMETFIERLAVLVPELERRLSEIETTISTSNWIRGIL